jgi:ribosomal protein S18 acetylase RimI-like enzyme
MTDELALSCLAGARYVDVLAGLYGHLHAHQARVAPQLGGLLPARSAPEAWARRRPNYVSWLERPSGFALLAHRGGEIIGYVLGSVEGGYHGWASPDDVIGVVHDLAVAPDARGGGVGSTLLDAAEAQLAQLGAAAYRLNVIAANTDALRLYERRGMKTVTRVLLARIDPAD